MVTIIFPITIPQLRKEELLKIILFFGVSEDKKLFEFAKADITKLAKSGKPFNMELVTIDTHTPDGYVCEDCQHK